MSQKRSTPQGKFVPNSFKTPPNLNLTVAGHGKSSSKYSSSKAYSSSRPNLDLTSTSVRSNAPPKIKPSIITSVVKPIDYDLECDLAYGTYLQALMKRHLVLKTLEKHESDMKDQLDIYEDSMFQLETCHDEIQQKITQLDLLNKAQDLLDCMQEFVVKLKQLYADFGLENILARLKTALEEVCNKLHLKNIKPVSSQEDWDKLMVQMVLCNNLLSTFKSKRDVERIKTLADKIRQLIEIKFMVKMKSQELLEVERDTTYVLAKNASDLFALKNNYEK